MIRRNNFLLLKDHPWLGKTFSKLSKTEVQIALDFIDANENLDVNEYEKAINRMFMNKPKPKRWTIICEMLSCSK